METVGDISGAIQQLKNLSDVTLETCCDELTRGVVEGLTDHKCISKLIVKGETVPPSKTFHNCTRHSQIMSRLYTNAFSSQTCLTSYLVRPPPSLEVLIWPHLMFVV